MRYFNAQNTLFPEINPLKGLFSFLLIFAGAYVMGQAISLAIVAVLFDIGMDNMVELMSMPEGQDDKNVLLMMQGLSQLLSFGGAFLLFVLLVEKSKVRFYLPPAISLFNVLYVVAISFTFIIVNSLIIEWNAGLELGGAFGEWAREMEDQMAAVTKNLTYIYSLPDLLFSLLVIAIIPGIVEELVFRGVLQTKLWHWTKNPHIAIWVSALLFSAIHLQFFGFVPRLALGVVFGYIFYFSGNLWYAIVSHIFNNGLSVMMVYYMQEEGEAVDLSEVERPDSWVILICAMAFILLMLNFYRRNRIKAEHSD